MLSREGDSACYRRPDRHRRLIVSEADICRGIHVCAWDILRLYNKVCQSGDKRCAANPPPGSLLYAQRADECNASWKTAHQGRSYLALNHPLTSPFSSEIPLYVPIIPVAPPAPRHTPPAPTHDMRMLRLYSERDLESLARDKWGIPDAGDRRADVEELVQREDCKHAVRSTVASC